MKKLIFGLLCLFTVSCLPAQKGSNNANFNQKVAGAYLAVAPGNAQLMQIFADGNLTLELSDEFPGNNNQKKSPCNIFKKP